MAEGVPGSFAQTPANTTFSQMKNRVARWVQMPSHTDPLNVAGECIKEAIDEYNAREWHWSIVYDDISLVADDIDYALLGNWKAPLRSQLYNSSTQAKRRMDYLDPVSFDVRFRDRSTSGSPTHYTCWWQKTYGVLMLSRPPSSEFPSATYPTLRHWHYSRLQYPTGNSDKLGVPSEVHGGILWLARAIIAGQYAESTRKYEIANSRHERIWREIVASDNAVEYQDFSI